MKRARRQAMDNFAKGTAAMAVAHREMKLPMYAVKVAGAHGVGTAIEHVRSTDEKRKAARRRQKAARRVNR